MNDSNKSSSSSSYIAHMRATTQSGRGTSTYDRAKAVSELTQLKKVVESLDKNGIVFAALVPVVERLQTQILAMDMKSQAASGTGSQMQVDEGVAFHFLSMKETGFRCRHPVAVMGTHPCSHSVLPVWAPWSLLKSQCSCTYTAIF
jgi:hypothetical protein